jgi:hypothetical protein
VTRLLAGAWHPLAFALIGLVYLTSLGSVLAARLAWAGRPSYWLAVLGAFFFLIGTLWGGGYLPGGASFTFTAAGAVLAVFGIALDLIFGQPPGADAAE